MDKKIINGKYLKQEILKTVKKQIQDLDKRPGLAAVLVGDNPASKLYVKLKKAACQDCGIEFYDYLFEEKTNQETIIQCLKYLNQDPEITGILVQLPLPDKFDTDKIVKTLDRRKDIDGFHPKNREKMQKCDYKILPPLPAAIEQMIKSTEQEIKQKNICILCNHKLFADPFFCLWDKDNQVNAVTTKDSQWIDQVAQADILIVSLGIPFFITKEMIKPDCTIIDVGINKLENGETVGDVNLADVADKVKFISPVPGGVGPVTVAMLLKNLLHLAEMNN